jgi:hypothetical protein
MDCRGGLTGWNNSLILSGTVDILKFSLPEKLLYLFISEQ